MQIPEFDPRRVHAVDLLFDYAMRYVGLIAAIALLVLVVVAALRRLLASRTRYNEMSVERWIAKAKPISGAVGSFVAFVLPQVLRRSIWDDRTDSAVLKELLVLTVGGSDNQRTLFTQTTAKLLAQIQLAANAAIDHPTRYPYLYGFLARTTLPDVAGGTDSDIWMRFTERLERSATKSPSNEPTSPSAPMGVALGEPSSAPTSPSEEEVRAASRARSRIDNVVARKLDALQVQIERGWESANLTAAVWTGIIIGVVLSLSDTRLGPWYFFMLILIGAVSGFVGHFLDNLASALDRVARPS